MIRSPGTRRGSGRGKRLPKAVASVEFASLVRTIHDTSSTSTGSPGRILAVSCMSSCRLTTMLASSPEKIAKCRCCQSQHPRMDLKVKPVLALGPCLLQALARSEGLNFDGMCSDDGIFYDGQCGFEPNLLWFFAILIRPLSNSSSAAKALDVWVTQSPLII